MLIPSIDLGQIEQIDTPLLNKRENPDSVRCEVLAIQSAIQLVEEQGVEHWQILSDCMEAVKQSNNSNVSIIPNETFQVAGIFIERILGRASYLRTSHVATRAPLNPLQKELFALFNAKKLRFKLSESLLWMRLRTQIDMVSTVNQTLTQGSISHYHHHVEVRG